MKKHIPCAVLLLTFSLEPLALLAQGSLTPPGPPGPTMKSLDQIEPRTPVSSAPFIISVPGSYYLTTNLAVSTGNAIDILTNGVTLDLNGFTISSTAPSAIGSAILLGAPGGNLNITIRNGFIQSGVTNNGSGTYTGSGFAYGIASSSPPSNVRVKDISISGCADSGIYLNMRNSTVVESCVVQTAGGYGIYASQVIRSVVRDCGAVAILGDNVSDCQAQNTSSVYGIEADTVQNCTAFSSSGYAIIANSAINCYASCTSGTGLNSTVAQNCYGYSGGAGTGILDTLSQNCYGSSNTGFGVDAANALNCYGHSTSGTGLYASQANSCYGNTESITYKYNMP